jgi:hypothetical protein
VAETHPHDIELFEYAEDELPQARRDEIAAHLATCSVCGELVRQGAAGREALRETTLLELPEGRREEILRNLPEPERSTGARRGFSKQLLAGIAALLVVAALAAVIAKTGDNSAMESSAGGTAGGAAEATPTSGGGGKTEDAHVADLFAGGPAEDVAADLQRKGFDAAVQQDRVVVHGATKAQVREALADRGPGDVEVVVKNP